ncbi:MAG TPA: LLM class flavin-dependent oxidoreductase [Actinomycetota bacterium]|nr:LLM class flavin-dependent oxidoreductase [Actinomycetota bacterium]
MEQLGAFFMTARTIADLERRILLAEELGYTIAGLPQIAGRDPMMTLASIAPKTTSIALATGIVPIWTRTPVALAQEAAVLNELTDGRFKLGIGVGHRELIESWHGTPFKNPLTAMRDYLTIVKGALEGMVEHKGSMFHSSFAFMGYQPQPLPVLIAALGPKMLQLAGEKSDGVVLWLSSVHHIKETVMPNITAGAAKAGKSVKDLEVFACLFAAPGPNRKSARDAIRRQIFAYVQLPFYRTAMIEAGFQEDLTKFDEAMKDGDLPLALEGLSDQLIDSIAATGNEEEVAQTLNAFCEAGCTVPGVGVVGGYEGYEGMEASLRAVRRAGALVA